MRMSLVWLYLSLLAIFPAALRLNVQQFPTDANVYDSLGEAYLQQGDKALAIESYKKSLDLNPQNENARDVLKDWKRPANKVLTGHSLHGRPRPSVLPEEDQGRFACVLGGQVVSSGYNLGCVGTLQMDLRGGTMNRRDFVRSASTVSAGLVFANAARLSPQALTSGNWRTFDVITRVEVLKPSGTTRVWVPAALINPMPFQKTLSNTFDAGGGAVRLIDSKADSLGIIAAEFAAGAKPVLTVKSRVMTRNYAVDLSIPGQGSQVSRMELDYFLRPTKLQPAGGIVRETSMEITKGAKTDVDKAHAIYEWIVDNTFRNPKTRGCGLGDIRFMLESKDLGGKCADLNALYVGLARAAGLPARDAYGIRLIKSDLGYKSLGPSTNTVTKAQHCRAEVYLTDYGWVPVDPADVRKVVLEEPPGNRPLDDEMVRKARTRLFGSWEMNWMAYNFASDVALPGSNGAPVAFLMYPQAETSDGRLDCLDPDGFKYEITAQEILSATS